MKSVTLSLTSAVRLSQFLRNLPGTRQDAISRYNMRKKIIPDEAEQKRVNWREESFILADGRTATILKVDEQFADTQYEILLEDAEWKLMEADIEGRADWTGDEQTIAMFTELEGVAEVKVKKAETTTD